MYEGFTDDELVSAAASEDMDAFAELYRRHRDRVFRLALSVTCDREIAADVTQDVFLKLHDRLSSFSGRSLFTTWLHRVVVNACHDTMRRKIPVPVGDAEDDVQSVQSSHAGAVTDRLTLVAALAAQPDEFRTVVVLHDLYDHRYDEIAEILGVPIGTVKSRLARGRLRLAQTVDPDSAAAAGNKTTDPKRPIRRTDK